MAQRQIIILRRIIDADTRPIFGYVLRADVPAARRPFMANPSYISSFVPVPPDSDPDATGLTNGAVVERAGSVKVDGSLTLPEVQALLIRLQAQFQTEVTSDKTFQRFGTYFDGAVWVPQGA